MYHLLTTYYILCNGKEHCQGVQTNTKAVRADLNLFRNILIVGSNENINIDIMLDSLISQGDDGDIWFYA